MAKQPQRAVRMHFEHNRPVGHTVRRNPPNLSVDARANRLLIHDMSKRLTQQIDFIPDGHRHASRLIKTQYTWPCFECKSAVLISRSTLEYLKAGSLTGVRCGGCLLPPDGGLAKASNAA